MKPQRLAKPRRLPPWAGVAWLILLAALAFATGLGKFLDERVKTDSFDWLHSPWLQGPLTIGLATAVFADAVGRGLGLIGREKEAALRSDIRKELGTAIATACLAAKIQPTELGAGFFMVRPDGASLVRVERVRLLDNVPPSDVTFSRGMGTVGKCWDKSNIVHHNWAAVNAKWATDPPDEATWLRTRDRTKHGLDYVSWTSLLGKYSEVLAVPVTIPGSGLVGVIALDRRWHEGAGDAGPLLSGRAVKDAVAAVAQVLAATLGKAR
jgi:hypothetical protein